ncbi:MAG: histidine phosphatase family protein [Opitutus sp.]|nr:histidine phosphatase family protein [Opitutus sp.]
MTTLFLVRHAQCLPLTEQPEPEWVLSALSAAQAHGLVPVLRSLGVERIYSSPYRRCRDTLAPFAAAHGIEVALHGGLRERRIAGQWVPDFREGWKRSWADFSYAHEGGEDSWTCRHRIAAAVGEIVQRHPGETLALGSHGNAIALFLHSVDPSFGMEAASALRTPEIVKVTHREGGFVWEKTFSAGEEF